MGVTFGFIGDRDKCATLISRANAEIEVLRNAMSFAGLMQDVRYVPLGDGNEILIRATGSLMQVLISCPVAPSVVDILVPSKATLPAFSNKYFSIVMNIKNPGSTYDTMYKSLYLYTTGNSYIAHEDGALYDIFLLPNNKIPNNIDINSNMDLVQFCTTTTEDEQKVVRQLEKQIGSITVSQQIFMRLLNIDVTVILTGVALILKVGSASHTIYLNYHDQAAEEGDDTAEVKVYRYAANHTSTGGFANELPVAQDFPWRTAGYSSFTINTTEFTDITGAKYNVSSSSGSSKRYTGPAKFSPFGGGIWYVTYYYVTSTFLGFGTYLYKTIPGSEGSISLIDNYNSLTLNHKDDKLLYTAAVWSAVNNNIISGGISQVVVYTLTDTSVRVLCYCGILDYNDTGVVNDNLIISANLTSNGQLSNIEWKLTVDTLDDIISTVDEDKILLNLKINASLKTDNSVFHVLPANLQQAIIKLRTLTYTELTSNDIINLTRAADYPTTTIDNMTDELSTLFNICRLTVQSSNNTISYESIPDNE